jgi:hypothetical protein
MSAKSFIVVTVFLLLLLTFAVQGALMCFWPGRWKAIQARLPRGYNPDSPGGKILERYRTRKATFADRLGGLAMLVMAVIALIWFLHNVADGKF